VAPSAAVRGVRRLQRSNAFRFGALLLTAVVVAAVAAPVLTPYDPTALNIQDRMSPPNARHWLGTDQYGRDLLTRILFGTRISLRTGVLAVTVAIVLGVPLGLASGFYGGITDRVLMRVVELLLVFPGILLALVIIAILGPSLINAMIAVGISASPTYARAVRSSALMAKSLAYVEAAQAVGCTTRRIMFRHVLPNTMATIIVLSTLGVATAIISAAALSFLGLGAQPPTPEWGAMLSEGRNYLRDAWWISTFPGLMIMLVVFAFNLVGDALRDVLDPQLRS